VSDEAKWKRFENLAAAIQKALAPGAIVEQNVHVTGRISGVERQIDIAIRTKAGQFDLLVAIDCKDYKVPVDVKDVESFVQMMKDVGASQGAIVAAQGFTQAAKTVAESAGVRLFTLVDAESEDWPVFVAIPVLFEEISITAVAYRVSSTELVEMDLDVRSISVFRADGTRVGPVKDLVYTLWNDDKIPAQPGEHLGIDLSAEPTYFQDTHGLARVDLTANVLVQRSLFFGYVPLVKVKGFRDDLKGTLITTSITTDAIDFHAMRNTWPKIESEEALAVRPFLIFRAVANVVTEANRAAFESSEDGDTDGSVRADGAA
jgi:hypothetical protein